MSIIMLGSEHRLEEAAQGATPLGPEFRDLLDQVAAQPAADYIRLMETAAKAEIQSAQSPQDI